MADQGGDLSGKVAIVTGAGGVGALGETTARTLAAAGAKLVLADLPGSQLDETAKALSDAGYDVAACPTDISQEDQVKALMAFAKSRYGRLDVVDNNAASQGHREDGLVLDMTVELWDKVFSVNARGCMLMCKHAIPLMVETGGGSIINISSGTALAGDMFATAYAATKGAINTFTRYVATQYGRQGVRCNAIAPGLITTPRLRQSLPEPVLDIFQSHTLIGELSPPQDIAEMVAFLASDRSRSITGQVISVDGGFSVHISTVPQVTALFAKG